MRLYNSLTDRKETFEPIDPADVRMYVCGPTVYDRIHAGNARPLVVFDVLFRLLRYEYGINNVRYVRNITDVDDKIVSRAAEQGIPAAALVSATIEQFQADAAELGTLPPTREPRATEHIGAMQAMITALIAKGHAYESAGHVLFDVASWPAHGGLAKRSADEMVAGARVEVADYKKNPQDFVLWKPAAGEPAWDSPWGRGRPGWHIECSAMAAEHLGEVFDIHGGGNDLKFPHHENEISQSRCAHGTDRLANYWLHNGFVNFEGAKMAKSAGNFVAVAEAVAEWPGEAVRFALLLTHYRKPMDFNRDLLAEAKQILDGWYEKIPAAGDEPPAPDFMEALADDLNVPGAVAALHRAQSPAALRAGGRLLGLFRHSPAEWRQWRPAAAPADGEIRRLVEARNAARRTGDYAEADAIRDRLSAAGVELRDRPGGETEWRFRAGGG